MTKINFTTRYGNRFSNLYEDINDVLNNVIFYRHSGGKYFLTKIFKLDIDYYG